MNLSKKGKEWWLQPQLIQLPTAETCHMVINQQHHALLVEELEVLCVKNKVIQDCKMFLIVMSELLKINQYRDLQVQLINSLNNSNNSWIGDWSNLAITFLSKWCFKMRVMAVAILISQWIILSVWVESTINSKIILVMVRYNQMMMKNTSIRHITIIVIKVEECLGEVEVVCQIILVVGIHRLNIIRDMKVEAFNTKVKL